MAHVRSYKGASSRPYGSVAYADPGLQADGKSRYPIDTEEHVRAAWAYIHHADNKNKYSPSQLRQVEGKIRFAMRRHGVDAYEAAGHKAMG